MRFTLSSPTVRTRAGLDPVKTECSHGVSPKWLGIVGGNGRGGDSHGSRVLLTLTQAL